MLVSGPINELDNELRSRDRIYTLGQLRHELNERKHQDIRQPRWNLNARGGLIQLHGKLVAVARDGE